MEPVDPVQMNIYQSNTYGKDLSQQNFDDEPRIQEKQRVRDHYSEGPSTQDINKIINSLTSNNATGPDGIPVKFIKLSANVIDSYLKNIINKNIDLNSYSENAKMANI